ncbi:hypothetical protein [Burkholderia cenocepacia]|jgi:plasmid maintenance system antidote protein VapI|uniref:hypothetical protein n=1 Tax=Burkholderia cenocepacia TaxID=95486 RepID=UPI00264C20BA|nr:hypothetical protein [Burkholderia cenocepacia]MDN7658483.1 hypothetical protein [Burkholderia cenocepacia]
MLDLNKTEVLAASPVEQHEAAPALSRQDIFDKFSFLEGLVSQSTYVSIAETAVAIYENASKAAQPEQPAADERAATPSAKWRVDGEPDPHGTRYDCERAALTLGTLTDDELANAVFMHGNERPPIQDVIAGTAFMPIVYLTAAKERIRWLSRALETARALPPNAAGAEDDANRGPCICQEDLGHPEGTCIWKSGRAPCAAPVQAAEPVAIPAGYALVPIEPTPEILTAIWQNERDSRRAWERALATVSPPPAPASAIPEIEPPQAGGNKGKLPALARTREGHNLYALGYNRGLKKGRDEVAPASAPVGLTDEQPSLTNPLTPYGMLVRALRIVSGTTLMDMAKSLLTTPAKLSAMEFGRTPVTLDFALDVGAYFDALGVPGTLVAIRRAIDAARAGDAS